MKKLEVAVIGTGFWGKNHVRLLNKLKNANVVAVYDSKIDRAKEIGKKYGVDYGKSLDEILSQKEVNAVTVCTPTITHKEIAAKVIEAGKNVFVEKPLANTSQEARELISLAKEKNVSIAVGFQERYNPAIRYVKSLIDKGKLGMLILLIARRVTKWPERIGDVGVVKDSAIHDIDIMRYLIGREVETVYAKIGNLEHKLEDFSEMILSFSGGEIGFIDANWLTPRKIRKLTVTGSASTATIDYLTQDTKIEDSKGSVIPRLKWEEPLQLELESYVSSVLDGRQPSASGDDGLKALEICEAALMSGSSGQAVKVGT